VNTIHARFHKQYLEEHLTDKSARSTLVLTINLEGVDLVAMGYKCNKRKVIHFIATVGVANTFDGDDPSCNDGPMSMATYAFELFCDTPLLPSIFPIVHVSTTTVTRAITTSRYMGYGRNVIDVSVYGQFSRAFILSTARSCAASTSRAPTTLAKATSWTSPTNLAVALLKNRLPRDSGGL
jgi:hypothetical protein